MKNILFLVYEENFPHAMEMFPFKTIIFSEQYSLNLNQSNFHRLNQ